MSYPAPTGNPLQPNPLFSGQSKRSALPLFVPTLRVLPWPTMNATFAHILIVEDESSIADTLSYALRAEGFETLWCNNAERALSSLRSFHPALILLDVGLPDRSGFELCKEIRQISRVPIIFLTARNEEVDKIIGLELGADDYVTKPFSPRELVARVKAILRRVNDSSRGQLQILSKLFLIDEERHTTTFKGQSLDLTRYEFRLLRLFVKRPGRVYSREALMGLAWETPEMSLERTVDTHIKTLRSKLRVVDPSTEYIITHRGIGYALREDA